MFIVSVVSHWPLRFFSMVIINTLKTRVFSWACLLMCQFRHFIAPISNQSQVYYKQHNLGWIFDRTDYCMVTVGHNTSGVWSELVWKLNLSTEKLCNSLTKPSAFYSSLLNLLFFSLDEACLALNTASCLLWTVERTHNNSPSSFFSNVGKSCFHVCNGLNSEVSQHLKNLFIFWQLVILMEGEMLCLHPSFIAFIDNILFTWTCISCVTSITRHRSCVTVLMVNFIRFSELEILWITQSLWIDNKIFWTNGFLQRK